MSNALHHVMTCECRLCRGQRAAELRRRIEDARRARAEELAGREALVEDWRPKRDQPGTLPAIHRRYA